MANWSLSITQWVEWCLTVHSMITATSHSSPYTLTIIHSVCDILVLHIDSYMYGVWHSSPYTLTCAVCDMHMHIHCRLLYTVCGIVTHTHWHVQYGTHPCHSYQALPSHYNGPSQCMPWHTCMAPSATPIAFIYRQQHLERYLASVCWCCIGLCAFTIEIEVVFCLWMYCLVLLNHS